MLRRFRIAFSVLCGITCLLIMVLWIRSQWVVDSMLFRVYGTETVIVWFLPGKVAVGPPVSQPDWKGRFQYGRHEVGRTFTLDRKPIDLFPREFWAGFSYLNSWLVVPYWFPALATAGLAASTWVPQFRRYSLRTLLILMTLVAIVFGVIAFAAR